MSEHAWVQENLDAYLTGGLSPEECDRVDRHVQKCTECAHLKAEISEMEQLMEGICAPSRPDAGLEDRAIKRLRQAPRPRPSWLRFVAAAAAVVVLGAVGGVVRMVAVDGTLLLPGMEKQVAARAAVTKVDSDHVNGMPGVDFAGGKSPAVDEEMKANDFEKLLRDDMDKLKFALKVKVTSETELDGKDQSAVFTAKVAEDKKRLERQQLGGGGGSDGFYSGDKGKGLLDVNRTFFDKEAKELGESKKKDEVALHKIFDKLSKDVPSLETSDKLRMPDDTTPNVMKLLMPPSKIPAEGLLPPGVTAPVPVAPASSLPTTATTSPPPAVVPTSKVPGYQPMPPPPVDVTKITVGADKGEKPAPDSKDDKKPEETAKKPSDQGQPKKEPSKVGQKDPPPEKTGRMIIRTGEMEFETDSFDSAVDMVTKLITGVKGGFIATINSDKLPNGKTKGAVIVRMPPQSLDKFIYDLRRELAKSSELKNQRLGSLDVTKQYTDIESKLRAARAIEERLIAIIKTGKGEIKDLVAAEKELGVWRTKIEEMEGEIRYYANQVALSTLTISLAEKEIQAPTAIVVTETVSVRIEVDDVGKAHQIAMKAVEDLKGRITRSELKQHTAGQFLSILHAEIPPAQRDAFLDKLKTLGIISDHQENQRQHTEGGSGKAPALKPKQNDVQFQVTMNNTANVRPRVIADLKIATTDVPGNYAKLLDLVTKVKGQVRDGKLNEQDKLNIHAILDFNVPMGAKPAVDKLLEEIGPVLERVNMQAPINELSTASKFGYTITLRDFASIPPRQTLVETIATLNVQDAYAKLQDAIAKAKGQVADTRLNEQDKFNVSAQLVFTVPSGEKGGIEKLLTDLGTVLSRNNVQTPVQQLATDKKFGYSLVLRDFASIPPSKVSDLKVATNDVPNTYAKLLDAITKAKGQLADAQLNEQDKYNISAHIQFTLPTDEKGAIDKLVTDLGTILSRTNVQAPMNQLSIAKKFGYSITLRDFANILPTHASDIKLATSDVPNNYAKLVDAVVKAKGQIGAAKLNEQDKLNIAAFLNFTVPVAEKTNIDKMLEKMGTLLSRNNVQAPQTELTTEKKFGYAIALRDFANIPPRETFYLQLAATDVAFSFRELQDAVTAAKGLVTVGQLTEDNKIKMEAKFEFDVPASERQAMERAFGKVGAIVQRTSTQVPVNELATDQKVGYKLTIRSTAAIPPREIVIIKLEVKDVDGQATDLREMVIAAKGRIIDSNIDRHENGQVLGVLKFEVPFASEDSLLKQIKSVGTVVSQQAKRNPAVPENELTTAHIIVTLNGVTPIVPSDEGLGSYVRTSLYLSFKVFSVCLMLIILGISAVLPWALVIWVAYKIYVRVVGTRTPTLATADGPTPPPGPAASSA